MRRPVRGTTRSGPRESRWSPPPGVETAGHDRSVKCLLPTSNATRRDVVHFGKGALMHVPRPARGALASPLVRRASGSFGALAIAAGVLTACGNSSGVPTLTWYINPDA